ncbi:MAG: site-specific integrase [Betaproteobacteria bacterium]
MAAIRKRGKSWRVQIRRRSHPPQFKAFDTRAEAEAWARQIEAEMDRGAFVSRVEAEKTLVADLLDRYEKEITPGKRSARAEIYRLKMLKDALGRLPVARLRPQDIASYRDQRIAQGMAGGTVIKDINTLSHVIQTARREWGINLPDNPVKLITRPKVAPGRQRRLQPGEEEALLAGCRASGATALPLMFQLALETAMRRGELLALEWKHIDLERRVAFLPHTKNGESRYVPLSTKAAAVLTDSHRSPCGKVFYQWGRPDSFKNAWRRVVTKLELEDFRFHDLRHEATSRFFERGLNLMQVAAITGHKTLQMLKRYTHLRAEDLVPLIG